MSTAKQEHNLNFKRNSYIPKMCVDPCPVGSTTKPFQQVGLQKHNSLFDFLYDIQKCLVQQDKPSSFFITAKPCNKHQERSA